MAWVHKYTKQRSNALTRPGIDWIFVEDGDSSGSVVDGFVTGMVVGMLMDDASSGDSGVDFSGGGGDFGGGGASGDY